MSLLGTILSLAALTALNYLYKRSVLYPPFIFTSIWLLDVIVLSLGLSPLDIPHAITLNVICAGAFMFSIGGAAAFSLPLKVVCTRFSLTGPPRGSGRILKWTIIGILAIGVCIQFRYLSALAASAGGGGFGLFSAARQVMIDESNDSNQSFRWFTYITTWTVFATLLFQLEPKKKTSRIMLVLSFLSCLASTGRGQFLVLLSAVSAIHLIRARRERLGEALRFARWPILGFGALFVILMFVNKDTSRLTVSASRYVQDSIVGYLCGSTSALDLVLDHQSDYVQPNALPGTLSPLFRAASALRLMEYAAPPKFENYVFVPVPINTFTVYKGWILDYGMIGGMAVTALVGFLQVVLYRLARNSNGIALFMFSLSVSSAILVFFVDTYTSFSFYAHAFAFALIYRFIRSLPPGLFRAEV